MERKLNGTVALVTGATGAIGAATARRLALDGSEVAVVTDHGQLLDDLLDTLTAAGSTALAITADLTDPDEAAATVQAVVDRFGRLDVLVNCAGVMLLETALHVPLPDWDRMIALNVRAMLYVTHAAVPYLIAGAVTSPRGVSDLVNVGSTGARVARPTSTVYNLTQSGLSAFSEALRQELVVERVRVSLVEPGAASARLLGQVDAVPSFGAHHAPCDVQPLGPDDIADAISYIVTRDRQVAVNELLIRSGDEIA